MNYILFLLQDHIEASKTINRDAAHSLIDAISEKFSHAIAGSGIETQSKAHRSRGGRDVRIHKRGVGVLQEGPTRSGGAIWVYS